MADKPATFRKLALTLATLGLPAAGTAQPTLAVVESMERTGAGDLQPAAQALGFFVEADGFLLTTYQQLTEPATGALRPGVCVRVEVGGETRRLPARIIGVEPTLNFAVLKVDDALALTPAAIAGQQGLTEGQEIYAVRGAEPADAVERERLVLGRLLTLNSIDCYQESLTQSMFTAEMLRPDAALGSPVFGSDGRVVALYNGYEPPHVPGEEADEASEVHLLPMHLISNIYDSLKERQSMASPWTGFSVRPLTPQEQARFPVYNGRFKGGIALDHVWPDSPAQAMGLQEGDILLQFAYHPTPTVAEFQKWLYMYGVGHEVKLYILRGEEAFARPYTVEERPAWAVPR